MIRVNEQAGTERASLAEQAPDQVEGRLRTLSYAHIYISPGINPEYFIALSQRTLRLCK